jgi:hypothetical protein
MRFSIGQRVRVIKKFPAGEYMPNSNMGWVSEMDSAIGKVFEVLEVNSASGYLLEIGGEWNNRAWFCEESLCGINYQLEFSFMQ